MILMCFSQIISWWCQCEYLWPLGIFFMCSLKESAWVNDFLQDSHLKSLSPSWTVFMCLNERLILFSKQLLQISHLLELSFQKLLCLKTKWTSVNKQQSNKVFNFRFSLILSDNISCLKIWLWRVVESVFEDLFTAW